MYVYTHNIYLLLTIMSMMILIITSNCYNIIGSHIFYFLFSQLKSYPHHVKLLVIESAVLEITVNYLQVVTVVTPATREEIAVLILPQHVQVSAIDIGVGMRF